MNLARLRCAQPEPRTRMPSGREEDCPVTPATLTQGREGAETQTISRRIESEIAVWFWDFFAAWRLCVELLRLRRNHHEILDLCFEAEEICAPRATF